MIDREKAIKGLECCLANGHNNCPYKSTDEGIDKVTSCTTYLMKDALAMLKEQEPMRVLSQRECETLPNHYERKGFCPKCHQVVEWYLNRVYCGFCGQAVKWNETD